MFRCINFVIPPSKGNVAGIERVTLMCANGIRSLRPDVTVRVHMFGHYNLPADLAGPHIHFHADCHPANCGKPLGKWLREADAVWIICQPMATLSLCIWHPWLSRRLRLLTVLHGALHIEMHNWRRKIQYNVFSIVTRSRNYKVAAVSRSLARYAEKVLFFRKDSVATLYNPVLHDNEVVCSASEIPRDQSSGARFKCVAVGRLDPQKGFDYLIPAFAGSDVGNDAELRIYGEGPDRKLLEGLIKDSQRSDQITLMGYDPEVRERLKGCDLFIMSSRYEGLSGALIEAIAARRPIVCTDHPFGAREALCDGELGVLVKAPFATNLGLAISDAYACWREGTTVHVAESIIVEHLRRFSISETASFYLSMLDDLSKATS